MQIEEPLAGAAPETLAADIHSEIQEYTVVHSQRRRLLPRAALVGLVAGLVGSLFRLSLAGGDLVRNALIEWARRFPAFGWIFPVLFGVAGAVISLALVRRFSPESKGSGIPHCLPFWASPQVSPEYCLTAD